MYAVGATEDWAIDSGATRHFSGFVGDFESIKRWNVLRIVRTADGSTNEALGYGPVRITTTLGQLLLPEVRYTV
jgi:hypothetical protein